MCKCLPSKIFQNSRLEMRWESMVVAEIAENDTTRIERWRTTISPGQKFKESLFVENLQCWSSSLQFLYCISEKCSSYKYICSEFRVNCKISNLFNCKIKTLNRNYIPVHFLFSFLRTWLSRIINPDYLDYLNCMKSLSKNKSCSLREGKINNISIIYYYLWQIIIINASLMLICLEIIAPISLCRLV